MLPPFAAGPAPKLGEVDVFDGLALARHLWPRFAAALILVALVFFPKPTYGLIEAEAKQRAQEITALLMDAVLPAAKQGENRAARHRSGLTGAPTGARLPDRDERARP